jgi:transcriptional regulator with XRE-family HTH domain
VPSDASRDLGAAIRASRIEKGFTQESFAAHVELDRSYYGAVERGEHNITIDTLAIIADGLGMPAWKVLRRAKI